MRKGWMVLILVLAAAVAARADTIILKSGRRISATEVHEEGNRVVYETPAGSMSLPKSIVDHVERGPSATYASGGASGGLAAAAAAMVGTAPPVQKCSAAAPNAPARAQAATNAIALKRPALARRFAEYAGDDFSIVSQA